MNFRNPKYTITGAIDCEYEHPTLGWIPFTAIKTDSEALGRDLYAAMAPTAAPYVDPLTPAQRLAQERETMVCTPYQMRKALRQLGLKSKVDAYIATASAETKDGWEYASVYRRNDPFMVSAIAGLGTPEQGDNLFRIAMSL